MADKDNKTKSNITSTMTPEQLDKTKELKEQAAALGLSLVDPNALDDLLKKFDQQSETIKALTEKVENVADKARLEKFESKQGSKKLARIVRLNVRNVVVDKKTNETEQKVIVGWKVVVDRVEKNPQTNVWTETQIVELIYEDETREQITYLDFAKNTLFKEAIIEKREKDEAWEDEHGVEYAGAEVLTVRTNEGKEYKIDANFVN